MPPCENDVEDEPGGGYEEGAWGRLGCGDCCRDCDWNPFRIRVSDWATGSGLDLSPRGPFLQCVFDACYERMSRRQTGNPTHRESSRSPGLVRCAKLALFELKGDEVVTGDINGPVARPLDF